MKSGDKIRVMQRIMGCVVGNEDFVVEEYRHCLGIFESSAHREAGDFLPLCELYEPGAESEQKYISNYGEYNTNMVQAWMDLSTD